ncbi:MAG: FAD-binding protein [bacterium]
MEEIVAEVIVLGGGPAAMRGVLAAMEAGADTLLVCKQSPGTSGNIVIARAGHSAPFGADDSPEIFLADTLAGGAHLNNPEVAAAMCEDATDRIRDLHAWGVSFITGPGGGFDLQPQGGHSKDRGVYPVKNLGSEVARPLRRKLDKEGAKIISRLAAVDLLVEDGRCRGVLAFDTRKGEAVLLRAGAVVLATGGAGQIFAENTNAGGITGDGYGMALRAGLSLIDMEFVQFYPAVIKRPVSNMVVAPTLFPLGARFFNEAGEDILRSVPAGGAATRDHMARAIYLEIMNGRGREGAVRMDLSEISIEEIEHYAPDNADLFARRSVSLHGGDIYITPKAHFFMGGVPIDADGATGMPGLLAAGEVTGGAHGANRLSNNAFTEAYALGARAGRAAAEEARRAPKGGGALAALAAEGAEALRRRMRREERAAPLIREIGKICWEDAGIVRRGEKLARACAALEEAAQRLSACGGERPAHALEAIEAENLCLSARAVAEAARFRRESRGAHYREDHPETDEREWRVNVAVRLRPDGSLELSKRPVGEGAGRGARR